MPDPLPPAPARSRRPASGRGREPPRRPRRRRRRAVAGRARTSVVQLGSATATRTLDDAGGGAGRRAGRAARAWRATGPRFPLLAKLIDAGDWLSLQVHPDDALARELTGREAVGKAEAWVVIDAAPGAELISGPADGLSEDGAAGGDRGRGGRAGPTAPRPRPRAGDVLLMRAGTLHAIGGGTFVYELQQPSDLTYRVSDWGRPGPRAPHRGVAAGAATPTRSVGAARHRVPDRRRRARGPGAPAGAAGRSRTAIERRPGRAVAGGRDRAPRHAPAQGDGWSETLAARETVVVPASIAAYAIAGTPRRRASAADRIAAREATGRLTSSRRGGAGARRQRPAGRCASRQVTPPGPTTRRGGCRRAGPGGRPARGRRPLPRSGSPNRIEPVGAHQHLVVAVVVRARTGRRGRWPSARGPGPRPAAASRRSGSAHPATPDADEPARRGRSRAAAAGADADLAERR